MHIQKQHWLRQRPTSGKMASCNPGKVQTVGGISHLPPGAPPGAFAGLANRQISVWQTVPISTDQQKGIYKVDTAIFSNGKTVLPYSQLVEIMGFLQQNQPNNPNTQSHRVASRPSPIDGSGAFAQRAYQEGEIIGFYTGRLVLRRPMPPRLYKRYKQLTGKRWKDISLPLYCIWHQNRAGNVEYQTEPDTYTAWSQVKIFNKNIELGIDGEHSGNPLRLLNHSNKPNTALLPTVNPKMLQHIRADGQAYVTDAVDLEHCLLIPVLARREIAKDEELTFHYRGYGGYPGYYCSFDDMGRDIVSNPAALMTWKPGKFPEFITQKQCRFPDNPGTNPRPAGNGPVPRPLPGPKRILNNLCIPLCPFRLDGESDQEFADRLNQLVNRSVQTMTMDTFDPDPLSSDPESEPSSDEEADQWRVIDSDSDTEPSESGDEPITDPEEELCRSGDRPAELEPSCSQLPQKRPAPAGRWGLKRKPPSCTPSYGLYRLLKTARPSEQPGIIWNLFSAYRLTYHSSLVTGYNQLCKALNRLAIPHNIEGEEPEWTPALAYHYFVNHGYIDGQSDTEKYRLIPFAVIKEWITRCQDDSAPGLFKQFCLAWLRDHQFRCGQLVFLLNLYGFTQHTGRQWDLPAIYHFMNAHPLSDQELKDWLTIQTDKTVRGTALWNLTRSGQKKAFHKLIQIYAANAKNTINRILFKINRGFALDKGIFTIDTPLTEVSLFKYIIKHDVFDLDDPEKLRCIMPRKIGDISNLLTVEEKQKLAWKVTEQNADELTAEQMKDKLFKDFMTDTPAQREQNMARNLLKLFQVQRTRYPSHQAVYNLLVTMLNYHEMCREFSKTWSEHTIYDFWLSHNVLDQTTKYDVMNFKILARRLTTCENPKKELAHFFHQFTKTRSPSRCLRHLQDCGITNHGTPYTMGDMSLMMTEYNLLIWEEHLAKKNAKSTVKKSGQDRFTAHLAWKIRHNADKDALKQYIGQWLARSCDDKNISLNRIARRIGDVLMKTGQEVTPHPLLTNQDASFQTSSANQGKSCKSKLFPETNRKSHPDNSAAILKPFADAFHAEVWTLAGLLKFIIEEGVLDFSNPQSFFCLTPAEAGQVLPDAYCLSYAYYAISQGKPAQFFPVWQQRCQQASQGFSPAAFYGALASYFVAHPPVYPYTLEQIRNNYDRMNSYQARELKALLLLGTMQFQAAYGCEQAPDSLLIFTGLLRGTILSCLNKVITHLQSYQIKIPKDAEWIAPRNSTKTALQKGSDQSQGEERDNLQGRAETVNWLRENLKKLLFLYDQKFPNGPGAIQR